MKKIIILVLISCQAVVAHTQTQGFVEGQFTTTSEVFKYKLLSNVHTSLTRHVGVNVFALASPKWGQIVIGPAYSHTDSSSLFRISTGVGVQADSSAPLYFNSYLLYTERQFSFFVKGEMDLKGSWWYTTSVEYDVLPVLGVGVQSEKYGVTGVKSRLMMYKGRLVLWNVLGYQIESHAWGVQVGLKMGL